jgi:hypothetical protein
MVLALSQIPAAAARVTVAVTLGGFQHGTTVPRTVNCASVVAQLVWLWQGWLGFAISNRPPYETVQNLVPEPNPLEFNE